MLGKKRGCGELVMDVPQTPTPSPHLYPQELQLKLYQAFIFSIPILFSIILVLLFYLFYLKKRASSLSNPPLHMLATTANPQTTYPYPSQVSRIFFFRNFKYNCITHFMDLDAMASVKIIH